MRRRAAVASLLLLLAGALLVRRRRRAGAAPAPLGPPAVRPASAAAPEPPAPPPEPPPDLHFVSVAWTLAAAPEDRAELTIRYSADPRLELDRVDAQETPTQVFVTVLMRRRAEAAHEGAAAQEREVSVALSAPLGGRDLVHAPADDGESSGPPLYP